MQLFQRLQRFSSLTKAPTVSVPIIDTQNFLQQKGDYKEDCKKVQDSLYKYGCVVIKDPRVNQQHNNSFLDMMEKYFDSRGQQLYNNQKLAEVFPEIAYQSGATPEYKERAREHLEMTSKYTQENKAQTQQPPPYDAKWRYFWQVSEGDQNKFIHPNVVPKDFPDWEFRMNQWGKMMVHGCMIVSEMSALGMDLPRDAFSKLLVGGHHLLAPTGSDLKRYNVGTVFAGFHYGIFVVYNKSQDLNFLTIHGKSRFPGLFVWLRSGERVSVSVPEGHLLLQAGKQFEILTGGYVTCGFHEVIYTDEVKQKMEQAIQEGRIPWRVSSTLFSHINYDVILKPIHKFSTPENDKKYPAQSAYEQVQEELRAISLKAD